MRCMLIAILSCLLIVSVMQPAYAQSDVRLRDAIVVRRLDGRGGIPLFWDGFIRGTYAGLTRDCIFFNYTGTGFQILRLQANGANVFTVDEDGDVVAAGAITLDSLALQDTDASNVLSLVFNEDDTADRFLFLRVIGGNRIFTLSENLTIANGGNITILTGTAIDGVITVEGDNAIIDQDVTADGAPTFNTIDANLPAFDSVVIDGAANARTVADGSLRILHTAGISNTAAAEYVVDVNSHPDTHTHEIQYIATGLAAGEVTNIFDLAIDTADATGGVLEALVISKTGTGQIDLHALHVGSGIVPIHQLGDAEIDMDQVFTYDDSGDAFTDRTAAFVSAVTNVEIFDDDDDIVYVGDAAQFSTIAVTLTVVSSGAGINPVFEYSTGAGGWTVFGPNDQTGGFRSNGNIDWEPDDLAGWATDTVNAVASMYWIRITRTRSNLVTVPTEQLIQIVGNIEYEWDENGDLSIRDIDARDIAHTGVLMHTPSAVQVIDAVDDAILANATVVMLNPDGDYTLTSTPTIADGSFGQILYIVCDNGEANTVTVQDQGSLGGSNLQLGAASRAISGSDVLVLLFDAVDWIEISFQNN